MSVIPIPAFLDNYIWAIVDQRTKSFDCVDPGDALPVIDYANQYQLQLRSILLTHHHHDHIGGIKKLIEFNPGCIIYGPDDPRIPEITHKVQEGQNIHVGDYILSVLSTPGHTSTHISFYESKEGWLFCGDTLFSAGCGRVFDGTMEQLHHSLEKIKNLPPTTKIFCAHEYTIQNLKFASAVEPDNQIIKNHLDELQRETCSCTLPSSINLELAINPFLRTQSPSVQNYALEHGAPSNDSFEVFNVLRNQKNKFI